VVYLVFTGPTCPLVSWSGPALSPSLGSVAFVLGGGPVLGARAQVADVGDEGAVRRLESHLVVAASSVRAHKVQSVMCDVKRAGRRQERGQEDGRTGRRGG